MTKTCVAVGWGPKHLYSCCRVAQDKTDIEQTVTHTHTVEMREGHCMWRCKTWNFLEIKKHLMLAGKMQRLNYRCKLKLCFVIVLQRIMSAAAVAAKHGNHSCCRNCSSSLFLPLPASFNLRCLNMWGKPMLFVWHLYHDFLIINSIMIRFLFSKHTCQHSAPKAMSSCRFVLKIHLLKSAANPNRAFG